MGIISVFGRRDLSSDEMKMKEQNKGLDFANKGIGDKKLSDIKGFERRGLKKMGNNPKTNH